MDPRLRGDDERITSATSYELIFSDTRQKMKKLFQKSTPDWSNLSGFSTKGGGFRIKRV
jgi:hypothetical protein